MPSDYLVRSRSTTSNDHRYSWDIVFGSTVYPGTHDIPSGHATWYAKWEEVNSRRNGWPRSKHRGDVGGDFTKATYTMSQAPASFDWRGGLYHYWGDILAHPGISAIPGSVPDFGDVIPSPSSVLTAGTRFIAEASPTAPQAGLSTAIVELKREGLPRFTSEAVSALSGNRKLKGALSGSGSDYLNWQFGWVPIISDVMSLAKSVVHADDLISQLYRDDGRVVRRKRGNPAVFESLQEVSEETESTGYPPLTTSAYTGTSKTFTTTSVERARWFSGAFMYHLPERIGLLGDLRRLAVDARYLLGLSASPIDVWNLVPWSWLGDWFFSSGDCISNLSDQLYNNQVLKYGYVMVHTKKVRTDVLTTPVGGNLLKATSTQTWDYKIRRQATPFGFGLSWDGFSSGQLAILSALGLSRAR